MEAQFDVAIAGGGFAGLTLARQLSREVPQARVLVVEREQRPLRTASHKVGESLVELSSHYIADVLGLADYMEHAHLPKNGLRFITGDTQRPLAERPEIGPSEFPVLASFQVDRGKFENDLRQLVVDDGVTLLEGESVKDIELHSDGAHEIVLGDRRITSRWVVDATGRRRLLQKKLGLRRPSPVKSSAAWFRVPRRIKIGELVPKSEASWHRRDVGDNRWLSTVHLAGLGYWVWIIPLKDNYTSIGLVADAEHHPFGTFNTEALLKTWFDKHEPVLGQFVAPLTFDDFKVMHDYSFLTGPTLSSERWSFVGDAAAFVDPLYSLGNDFLAMANTYTVRAISDELRGELDEQVIGELNRIFELLTTDASTTLNGNGEIFPHADVLGAKLWWDFYNYWSFMCAHYFQSAHQAGATLLARMHRIGERYVALNAIAQRMLETWASMKLETAEREASDPLERSPSRKPGFTPLPMFPSVLADQHVALQTKLSPSDAADKMEADLKVGHELVAEIVVHALRDLGPSGAAEYGRRTDLANAPLPLEQRGAIDGLSRRARLEKMPRIGRDMERALGRKRCETPLSELIDQATLACDGPDSYKPSTNDARRNL